MRALIACIALFPLLVPVVAPAASAPLDANDCATVLERWANDPKSVPKRLVDQCREQLAAAPAREWPAPGAGANPDADPCAGAGADSSVLCWGPWATLAPAAAPPAAEPPETVSGYDPRPELADEFDPDVEPPALDLPLGSCTPGAACGFATVVNGVTSSAPSADTRFARIDLAADGSAFAVDPGAAGEIDSVTGMDVTYLDRPDEFENLQATGRSGDEQSRLVARVLRDEAGDIEVAADVWSHGNRATRSANSGYFAWGNSTTQAGLDALRSGAAVVSFSGPMSVDNRTTGSMTLDFGSRPGWSGNWVNPGYSFSAGGPVSGVDLVSDRGRFSANVLDGSVVQGVVLGEPGNQSIAHIIDVNLSGVGLVRDVGLLRQALPGSPD
jgi:hypothetical protein